MRRVRFCVSRFKKMSGFTLLEILVAMTLLSLVMLALGGALRSVAQAEERIDIKLSRADDFRTSVAFLRKILGHVSAKKVPTTGEASVLFAASSDAVAWVGVMPARYGAGGRYFFRLAVETEKGTQQGDRSLVIRFLPFKEAAGFPDWATASSRILVTQVTSFGLVYEDSPANPVLLRTEWSIPDRLPDRIRLNIQTAAGAWPMLVVPLRALPWGSGSAGGFSIGGSVE